MAWQSKVKSLCKKYGCSYKQGRAIYQSLQAGIDEVQAASAALGGAVNIAPVSEPVVPVLSSSNPVSLITAAGNLFAAAGGNEGRAREALDAYLRLSAEPTVDTSTSAPAPASSSAQNGNGSAAKTV